MSDVRSYDAWDRRTHALFEVANRGDKPALPEIVIRYRDGDDKKLDERRCIVPMLVLLPHESAGCDPGVPATAVSGIDGDPTTFYFGGAGGGVWKSTDAGRTWRGLMQNERASAIGALAVAPSDPRVLYAGTGQPDARYDIMAGEGVYRSADGGESWTRVGLETSRHIGAILVHPKDANRVLVASLGHVFGSDPQRTEDLIKRIFQEIELLKANGPSEKQVSVEKE